jgi:hypothetical protein
MGEDFCNFLSSKNVISVFVNKDIVSSVYEYFLFEKQKNHKIRGFSNDLARCFYIKSHFSEILKKKTAYAIFHMFSISKIVEKFNDIGAFLPFYFSPSFYFNDEFFTINFEQKVIGISIVKSRVEDKIKKIKFPVRKKYRDLDKQAIAFVKNEIYSKENYDNKINFLDWILIKVSLFEFDKKISDEICSLLWIRISEYKIDLDFSNFFIGKKEGDRLKIKSAFLQKHFYLSCDEQYDFYVEIKKIVSNSYFDVENLSRFFKCESKKELYSNIINTISFYNDVSVHRYTNQIIINKMLELFKVSLPREYVLEVEERVIENIKHEPDYILFQSKKNFNDSVRAFVSKNITESALVDHISKIRNIKITDDDVCLYFNILQRKRIKDFIYFDSSFVFSLCEEVAIPHEIALKLALREKALHNCNKFFKKIFNKD